MPGDERILVIKHGALGDWVLATGCFSAIRRHHPSARITLLTTPAFADWGARCPWFDEVWTDERPSLLAKPLAWVRLRRRLIDEEFARVYDLQTSGRTGLYFRMLPRRCRPEWSGDRRRLLSSAPQSSVGVHAYGRGSGRAARHRGDRRRAAADSRLAGRRCGELALPDAFSLIVPGGSAHRPEKRWPAEQFADLARHLSERGSPPVLIGTAAEAPVLASISREVPGAINLGGRTSLGQIAALARRATCAVGNDTGPIHIAATVGCPTVALFGAASDPKRSAPCGQAVTTLRRVPLASLAVDDVIDATRRISKRT